MPKFMILLTSTLTLLAGVSCRSSHTPNSTPNAGPQIPEKRNFELNSAVNPCEDFYAYACSKTANSFTLRPDRSRHVFSFDDSNERLLLAKKKFFSEMASQKDLSARSQQLSDFYKSCMQTTARKEEEPRTVERVKKELSDIHSNKEFSQYLIRQTLEGREGFFVFFPDANMDDPTHNDLILLPNRQLTSLPERTYFDKPAVVKDLNKVLVVFFEQIGMDQPQQRADWVLEMEKSFAKVHPLPREIRELWSKRSYMSREELQKKYPNLHLDKVLNQLPKTAKIRNVTAKSLAYLNQLLNTTSLEKLKSYYAYMQLRDYMDEAFPKYFQAAFDFSHTHLGGPPVRADLHERCTKKTMKNFNHELDATLLPVIFPNFDKQKLIRILEEVRGAIIAGVERNKWLSPKAREEALKKIKLARFQIVAPEAEKDWDFHPEAKYDPNAFIKNQELYDQLEVTKVFREIKEPRNPDLWHMGPLTVNAYYSADDNKFVMPVGILQYPFYDPSAPDSTNLGAVGSVVGHELGHGIDDQGSKYDSTGKLRTWMTPADLKKFKNQSHGLVKQFEDIGHDGRLTLGENIADLVGLTFAYDAAFAKDPGTPEARRAFFTQYAFNWCGVIRPQEAQRLLKTDPHAAVEARVNQQVRHQQGFVEAFQCKPGDKMYLPPEKRVHIW